MSFWQQNNDVPITDTIDHFLLFKGGGSKQFFGRSHFEHRALGAPSHIGETFGEDSGPRRPTGFEPSPELSYFFELGF